MLIAKNFFKVRLRYILDKFNKEIKKFYFFFSFMENLENLI